MPAAAVILTPRVFVHSAAVKKFVVGPMSGAAVRVQACDAVLFFWGSCLGVMF